MRATGALLQSQALDEAAGATAGQAVVDAVEEGADVGVRRLEAELLRRLFFEVVRFVDDEVMVLRQDVAADRDVGQEQRMVHDDDVGGLGALSRPLEEAGAVPRVVAGEGDAGLAVGAEPLPDGIFLRREA